jgi:hypothetical protein
MRQFQLFGKLAGKRRLTCTGGTNDDDTAIGDSRSIVQL